MLIFDPVWILSVALLAYVIDRIVGEFLNRTHPVVAMGHLINGFQRHFYADSVATGGLLVLWVLTVCFGLAALLSWGFNSLLEAATLTPLHHAFYWLSVLLAALLVSTLFAHKMLYDSVLALLNHPNPQQPLAMLVSRDTAHLSQSDCYKAGIETYAENLSDGVIAPLFYFLLFGLPGLVVYKAINTLDSMVGYRTPRYERFGKVAAKVDDLANWIPARLSAWLIKVVRVNRPFCGFYKQGTQHASPNAGHPITAMAQNIGVQLGGDTMYFGILTPKARFGDAHGPTDITAEHLLACLAHRPQIDALLISAMSIALIGLIGFNYVF
jgi:adenosylcobinamide-phosphate synthase